MGPRSRIGRTGHLGSPRRPRGVPTPAPEQPVRIPGVGPAHLEGLGSVEAVARAKGELFAAMPAGATGIVNADDVMVATVCAPLLVRRARLCFGWSAGCDLHIDRYQATETGSLVTLQIEGVAVDVELPLWGRQTCRARTGSHGR